MVLFSSEIEWIARVSSCHRKPPSLAVDTVLYSYQRYFRTPSGVLFLFSRAESDNVKTATIGLINV